MMMAMMQAEPRVTNMMAAGSMPVTLHGQLEAADDVVEAFGGGGELLG